MKKLLIIIPLIFILSACSYSSPINLTVLSQNINKAFSEEIFLINEITIVEEDEYNVSYWIPEKYNLCCSFFSDKNTGKIAKYTVTSNEDNKSLNDFYEKFEKGILKNNIDIVISSFITDGMIVKVYQDVRYSEKMNDKTLKHELDEIDIEYPVSENTLKHEN